MEDIELSTIETSTSRSKGKQKAEDDPIDQSMSDISRIEFGRLSIRQEAADEEMPRAPSPVQPMWSRSPSLKINTRITSSTAPASANRHPLATSSDGRCWASPVKRGRMSLDSDQSMTTAATAPSSSDSPVTPPRAAEHLWFVLDETTMRSNPRLRNLDRRTRNRYTANIYLKHTETIGLGDPDTHSDIDRIAKDDMEVEKDVQADEGNRRIEEMDVDGENTEDEEMEEVNAEERDEIMGEVEGQKEEEEESMEVEVVHEDEVIPEDQVMVSAPMKWVERVEQWERDCD
ncbi:uncharacterized protein AB675_3859 [Cyphellophora attinorum]|uniref:Uncharacterized protein n=1 Tax=Cyphellophora attinorum TaxID=1664694 RepID=A0A0N1H2W2_9EURO|nr:uncharacterized protein AB675_3859 [Phialophora attinorum]KPI34920.1 hypothetical protein AB675_3859 [Phialophora attinorum]